MYFGRSPGCTLPFSQWQRGQVPGLPQLWTRWSVYSEWREERMYVLEGCVALMPIVSRTVFRVRCAWFWGLLGSKISKATSLHVLLARLDASGVFGGLYENRLLLLGVPGLHPNIAARRLMTAPFLCGYYSLYPPFSHTKCSPKKWSQCEHYDWGFSIYLSTQFCFCDILPTTYKSTVFFNVCEWRIRGWVCVYMCVFGEGGY